MPLGEPIYLPYVDAEGIKRTTRSLGGLRRLGGLLRSFLLLLASLTILIGLTLGCALLLRDAVTTASPALGNHQLPRASHVFDH